MEERNNVNIDGRQKSSFHELEAKIGTTSNFLTSIWGVLTIAGTIVVGTVGGYWWLQDSIVERNAKIISSTAIEQIKQELNPLSTAEYREDRRRDSIERINAELLALEFMHSNDSLMLVLTSEVEARKALARQLGRIETKVDAQDLPAEDDKLARIWEYLKTKETNDSTDRALQDELHKRQLINEEKIKNIKSGDRAK